MKTHAFIPYWDNSEGSWKIKHKEKAFIDLTDQEANYIEMTENLDPDNPEDLMMLKKIFVAFAGEKPSH